MDFNKGDFQKGNETKACRNCGAEGTFTLVVNNLKESITNNNSTSLNQSNLIRNQEGFNRLFEQLRKNIFRTIDEIEDNFRGQRKSWEKRIRVSRNEHNQGLLEVLHFLGCKVEYNNLLFSLPSDWDKQLSDFIEQATEGNRHAPPRLETVNKEIASGRNPRTSEVNNYWFVDCNEGEGKAWLGDIIRGIIGRASNGFVRKESDNIVNLIYTSLSDKGVKKFGNWDENYETNSPLSVLIPNNLRNQFKQKNIVEGIEYCNHCGTEDSRSLRYKGSFKPFTNSSDDVSIQYDGRIQDMKIDLLPVIQSLWEEQVEEFNRRDKKATKMWDGAKNRFKKKLKAAEDKKRKAEIAKLEEKLKSLKNNEK